MKARLLLLAMVGTLMLLVGCHKVPTVVYLADDGRVLPEPPGPGLVAQQRSPIADVSMPMGFLFIESRSTSTMVPGRRFAKHIYQGRADRAQTVDFYRRTLPLQGWQELSAHTAGESSVLRYHKGRETLEVQVSEAKDVSTVFALLQDQGPVPLTTP